MRRPQRWRFSIIVVLATVALIGSTIPGETASRQPVVPPQARIAVHEGTGKVRFIGSEPGRPLPRPPGISASASPQAIARAFLDRYGASFGIRDQAAELRVRSSGPPSGAGGRSTVRFQQVHRGVPVLGGELIVNLDREGNALSVSGEVLPAPDVPVTPLVTGRRAQRVARGVVAKSRDAAPGRLDATEPTLWIHDARLLGGPGLPVPRLVWRMDVTGAGPIDEMVLVDARLGNIVLHFDQIAHAKDRRVCDANSTATQLPCASPVRVEGGAAHAVQDVNNAYDFSGDTYDFFFDRFGRDSLDGAGMALRSTVRYCPNPGSCPYQNAFWNGAQMVYGAGFAVDDVVGHELMHGVTNFTSRLFYYYQSGAINESLSDVFGEFVDLTNGAGNDAPGVRWLLGEEIPGIGAIRNMANPPAFGHPDRMTSPQYTADPNEADGGGVHTNSGVNNKAAFLITDGGSFNGQTVTGLGIDKAALIYYEVAANLLTSASDYADLSTALTQGCANLVGSGGITSDDCAEVAKVVLAVEMDQAPPAAPNPEAPVCGTGEAVNDLFFDDLENPASGTWARQTVSGVNEWYYPQNSNPYGFDATYATSGTTNFWGYNRSAAADYSIRMTIDVPVPAGSDVYLHFRHAYGFEDDSSRAYDGGVLEYSTTGGSTWTDAAALFTHQGYNGTITPSFGNPLAGRSAFVRESNGYISSRLLLSSLAGQSVRFRFRIGTDSVVDDYGWFVDDIRIYTCGLDTGPPNTSILTGPSGPTNNPAPTFTFSATESGSSFECRFDAAGFSACTSPHTAPAPLADGGHTFEVAATNLAGNTDPTPASRSFTVDTVAPTDPTVVSSSHTPGVASRDRTVDVAWSGASDDRTGVDGFSYLWNTSPTTVPNTVKNAEEDAVGTTSPSLADGASHWFHLRTRDNAGNWTGTVHLGPFAIDGTPPETTITRGPRARIVTANRRVRVRFAFISNEPGSTFRCKLDAAPWRACASPKIFRVGAGRHVFRVAATDPVLNRDPTAALRRFRVVRSS